MLEMVVPDGLASSLTAVRAAVVPLTTVGASLIALMVSPSATVPELTWLVPPVAPTPLKSLVAPSVTEVGDSIRCAESAGAGPLKSATGTKRRCAVGDRSSALAVETPLMSVQLVPLLDHCQVPWVAALAASAVIAMPAKVLADDPPLAV
jgi:hypothetical protein